MSKFTVWHPSGIQVEIKMDDPQPDTIFRVIDNALACGFLVEQPVLEEGDTVEHVIGYTIGEYKGEEGGFQPCVLLWHGPPLKYALVTVYPEKFDRLPFPVGKAEWQGGPLDEELARLKNVFRKWEADVTLTPKMKDGEVVRTAGGNVVRKFVGVKGHTPQQPAESKVVVLTDHDILVQKFDQAGMKVYGTGWKEKREEKERRDGKPIEQHSDDELRMSISTLENVKGKGK